MSIENTEGHWGSVAKALHWSIAALVFAQIPLGIFAEGQREAMVAAVDMSQIERVSAIFSLHKSIGLTLGLLVIARMIWRVTHYVPPLSGEMPWQLRALAHITHWGLYVLLLTLVASGFVASEGAHARIDFFYLFELPNILTISEQTKEIAETVHKTALWSLVVLVLLHVGAAVTHHRVLKDDTMVKMLPGFLGGRTGPVNPNRH